MLNIVLLLALRPQADIEVPAQVAPLERLIPAIGRQAGMTLIAHDSVRADVLGLASPKRPITEILDVIAKAVNGTWIVTEKGLELLRSGDQVKADQATDLAFDLQWMARVLGTTKVTEPFDAARAQGLAAYRKAFKSKENHDSADYEQTDEMNNRSPLGRLTRRLIEGLGLETVARLPQGRSVLSTRPNGRQIQLKESLIQPALKAYVQEQGLYAEAVKALGEPVSHSNFVSGFDHVSAPPAAWNRVLLVVDKTNPFQYFFHLALVGQDDLVVGLAPCYINRDLPPHVSQPERGSPEVVIPPEVLAFSEAVEKGRYRTLDLLRPFAKPIERDPLSFVNDAFIAAWSEWKKKPVAVLLPDSANAYRGFKASMNVSQLRTRLEAHCSFVETEAAVIGRPLEPYRAVQFRTDRKALQRLVSASVEGWAPISALVDFAPYDRPNSSALLGKMLVSFESEAMAYAKVIAIGDVAQQKAMLAGGKLAVGQMTNSQRLLANQIFFNASSDTDFGVPIGGSILNERTERFPDGLPADATLISLAGEQPNVLTSIQGRTVWASASNLAYLMHRRDESAPKEFQFAISRELVLSIDVNGNSQPRALRTQEPEPGFAKKQFSQLPLGFREEVEKYIRVHRERAGLPPH